MVVELIFRVIDDPLVVFCPWNAHAPSPGARPDRRAGLCRLCGIKSQEQAVGVGGEGDDARVGRVSFAHGSTG